MRNILSLWGEHEPDFPKSVLVIVEFGCSHH